MTSKRGPPPDSGRPNRRPSPTQTPVPPATRTEGEGETLNIPVVLETFSQGQVLGNYPATGWLLEIEPIPGWETAPIC